MELNNVADDVKDKNDGMYLIIENGYSVSKLRDYIEETCLAQKCDFLKNTEDIEEVK